MNEPKIIFIIGSNELCYTAAVLLSRVTEYSVYLVNHLQYSHKNYEGIPGLENVSFVNCPNNEVLEAEFRKHKPYAILSYAEPELALLVAAICAKLKTNFVDYNTDTLILDQIVAMNFARSSCVLGTGLYNGFAPLIGTKLLYKLQLDLDCTCAELHLRIGALPRIVTLPRAYALVQNASDIFQEYTGLVTSIQNGVQTFEQPLDGHEQIIIEGSLFEAFNIAGNFNTFFSSHPGLQEFDFKVLRYPGHLDFVQKRISPLLQDPNDAQKAIEQLQKLFPRTRDDFVLVANSAVGVTEDGVKYESTACHKIYGKLNLTATALCTVSVGVAVIELMESLPHSISFGADIGFDIFNTTKMGEVLSLSL
jgi:saccharopine dehydrogenase-like NADP-dependent oxidoreductase